MSEKGKIRFISEEKTKELQKDWKGYGRSQVLFGLVVLAIIVLAVVYQFVLKESKENAHRYIVVLANENTTY